MKEHRRVCVVAAVAAFAIVLAAPVVGTAGGSKKTPGSSAKPPRRQLDIPPAPSFGPPQQGYIYGGPYPPPYPLYSPYGAYPYAPYPYAPYPWTPPPAYPPSGPDAYSSSVIPAGRLALIIDPVSAEVFVDGHRLTQHADLSYEVGLLVGSHTVSVKKDGYEPFEQAVEIPPNQRVMLTIRLQPAE